MPLIMNAELDKLDGLAPRACELCRSRSADVMRCAACQAVYYCGRACQAADREEHRIPCRVIRKARAHYEAEYVKLRDMPGDMLTPERMFDTEVGNFWSILETRPYMRARYGLVDALLLSYGTPGGPADVVQTCLDHLLDMLRLSRSDGMGVRQVVPGLLIRLGRDQDAYDFVRWHTTTAAKSREDDRDLNHNDDENDDDEDASRTTLHGIKDAGADVLEEPLDSWVNGKGWMPLSHVVAVTLVKVRVLLDLRAIRNASLALRGAVPAEIVDLIRGQLVGSGGGGIVGGARQRELLLAGPEETARLARRLRGHVNRLYAAVDRYNPHFWDILVNKPDAGVLERPSGPYGQRTRDEALLVVGYNFASWYETPGAVDVLRSLAKKKAAGGGFVG
ncbi:hypothetical protein JDV02_004755 [Purpureocillium takamizusanense]|uniref:MYND-type domain-containing protein n=1 Tax=Purpureocillium takamizusanense TaxID=2060973 RepID=A0A9Q8QD30_9HYPO|nr:uncharacterized protein JDV02_004755 [Purpureocillium takamizusanense]UNI18489.1 hypothetical protein JDV02_004755 [Purpureocillium takamizusanense]